MSDGTVKLFKANMDTCVIGSASRETCGPYQCKGLSLGMCADTPDAQKKWKFTNANDVETTSGNGCTSNTIRSQSDDVCPMVQGSMVGYTMSAIALGTYLIASL